MQIEYRCADCCTAFIVKISDRENRTTISGARTDRCPKCRMRVGYGTITCIECGNKFVGRMPLHHAKRRLSFGACPACTCVNLAPCEKEQSYN